MTETLRRPLVAPASPVATLDAPEAGGAGPRLRLGTFTSLQHRGYLYMWIGVLFTSAGAWMEQVAISWLVYQMTDSAFLLGAINGMRALPFLALAAPAGVAADRMHPKQLMLWSQGIILALYVGLVALLYLDMVEVWHLFVFTLGASAAWSFNQPVRQALIPYLVPRHDLMNAVALQSVGFNVTRVLGPGIGGVLMATVGGGGTFLLVTLTWVGVMVTTYLIPVPSAGIPAKKSSNAWEDLVEGLRYIRRDRVVLGLLLLALAPLVFAMPYMSLMPIFARDVFGMDARGLGELMTATGVGAIVSTLAVASLGDYRGRGKLLLGSGVGFGLSVVAFAFSTSYPLSLAILVVVGLFSMAYLPLTNTLLQLNTPQEYMGRVMSIYMLDRGLMPLGSFAAGAMAEALSAPLALGAMGALSALLIVLGVLAMPQIRRLD
ncbi:MAG: MFS transporter [Chloroflexi bacterium]|nr:MFS transporter [Chloroflexota bacterium]